ncbi:MAG: hypothetical protein JWO78_2394 [Micavibrio sp.]|nr:hypothetical protein [Micavibrio sp.]
MTDPLQIIALETAALREGLEHRRQRYWKIYLLGLPACLLLIGAIAAWNSRGQIFPWAIVGVAGLVLAVIGFQALNILYRTKTKLAFLARIASALGLAYARHGRFNVREVDNHQILPNYDIARVEDGFSGMVGGVRIMFEEAVLSERNRQQNPHTGKMEYREQMTFWGLIIRIGIGKNLQHHTIVMPRNRLNSFFRTTLSRYKPVNLVSPKFEAKFDTIATDQVEARYVLDPAFMERFMEADALANTRWLSASFLGNEIAIAIERNRAMFEIGALWRPLSQDVLAATLAELTLILKIVETLKLNPHTGLGASLPER